MRSSGIGCDGRLAGGRKTRTSSYCIEGGRSARTAGALARRSEPRPGGVKMSDVFDRWAGADADAEVLARLREEVARHWKLVLGIGVVSILAGAFAILAP